MSSFEKNSSNLHWCPVRVPDWCQVMVQSPKLKHKKKKTWGQLIQQSPSLQDMFSVYSCSKWAMNFLKCFFNILSLRSQSFWPRSLSGSSQIFLRSLPSLSLTALWAYFVRQVEPKILCLVIIALLHSSNHQVRLDKVEAELK